MSRQELDRRLAAAQAADPTRTRTQAAGRDLVPVGKTIERLLTASQEDSVSIDQLRERMLLLRQRKQALRHELNAPVSDEAPMHRSWPEVTVDRDHIR